MNIWMWLWLYESWLCDIEEKHEFAKNYSVLIGSATNPEWANKIIKRDNPDYEMTEEDFDRLSKEIATPSIKETSRRQQHRKLSNS